MNPAKSHALSPKNSNCHMPTSQEVGEYMPLVHQTVGHFLRKLPPNVLRDDLLAAGSFGLIDALRRGETRGPTFEWYARVRIRGAILDELRTQDWLKRRARSRVTASQGAERATVIGLDDVAPEARAQLDADDAPSALTALEQRADQEGLVKAVDKLPERERFIVQSHYFNGVAFKAIAQTLRVSEPRISQLHARAIDLLRTALHEDAA
jgi:RNA polymerase sigma factor for flagellar operon FliA